MNILVIGKGGREHALVWKLARSPLVETVFCAPGNPGMTSAQCVDISGAEACADFAVQHDVGLTVVGPEAPLCEGIVDVFRARGLPIFGPDRAAARLEGSKQYAKQFMNRYQIPTAAAESFDNVRDACACVERFGAPVVVKADGLAAGKGVTVAQTEEEAKAAVHEAMSGVFGEAGQRVLIEECLVGEEASILALVDGKTIVPLASSQDHKRAKEGDTGPNTGGMGAYSPAPVVDSLMWQRIQTEVLDRFLAGCQGDGLDYRGVIYAGVMVTSEGPKVLEFNVRFGDPETQAVLPRLRSDLASAMVAVVEGRLSDVELDWSPEASACVVLAAGGYPGPYEKGQPIRGVEDAETTGALVFHAGTGVDSDGNTVTDGGRVLGVSALGDNIATAVRNAYRAVDCISFPNMQFRRDIAHRAIVQELDPQQTDTFGKHLFILSGQSNMARLDPNISFTPTLTKTFGGDGVIVVKDAQGGEPIRRWYKQWHPADGDRPEGNGDLYDRLLAKVQAAITDEDIATVTFVWMQGERDAREQHADVYADSFKGLLQQLREDIGRGDIHVVIGRLSDFDLENRQWPEWTRVRAIQVELAEELPSAAWVDTDDLNDGEDENGNLLDNDLHYSVEGYRKLGERFANAAIELIESSG